MEILVQSVLAQARRLRLSLHLRYLDPLAAPTADHANFGGDAGAIRTMTSVVIIQRAYRYLEPIVRSMFTEAPDVEVLLDRRWHDRRNPLTPFDGVERRARGDRRAATPMLDILIDVHP